jgi:hypothetical protein
MCDATIWNITLESSIMILEASFDHCNMFMVQAIGWNHRDKTRVQMPAKIFPHLKVKC